MTTHIYELLGYTQPNRETQVRNDAYELYNNEIRLRASSLITLPNSEIALKYGWKANRAVKAIRRLRQAGIIDIFEYQSKKGFKTTVYTSRFGLIDESHGAPVESVQEVPAQDELDSSDDLDDFEMFDSSTVIYIEQPRLMEIANAIAEVLTEPMSMRAIARASGENKIGVDRAMKRLASEGCVAQNESGQWIKTTDFIALNF